MIGQSLQVDAASNIVDHPGLAGTGLAADQHQVGAGHRALQLLQEEAPHSLVAAQNQGVVYTLLPQPLLHRARSETTAKTVEVSTGIGPGKFAPGRDSPGPGVATDELVSELDGRFLTLFLIAGANLGSLVVGHQRQADGAGK